MTLTYFLPLALAVIAIIDLIAFRILLSRGKISERMFNLFALVSILLPLLAYIVLAVIVPDVGAILLF